MNSFTAALMGTLAGVFGTGAGGLLSFAVRKPNPRLLACLLSLTGGMMLSVACFELLPEAFLAHSIASGLAGLLIGVGFIVILDQFALGSTANKGILRVGLLMSVGIAVHNFPEGLAIGAGYATTPALGMGLCAIIAMHDLPEGLAMGIPLRQGGMSLGRVVVYALLAGLPTGFGALVGFWLGNISSLMISGSMGIAGGAMLYLTCSELLPQAEKLQKSWLNGVMLCIGVALGIVATYIV